MTDLEEKRARQREYDRRFEAAHPERRRQQKIDKARRWNEKNPERFSELKRTESRARHLRMHGLTAGELDELRQQQDGRCYLCGDDLQPGRGTHIDHDHACCEKGSCNFCRRGLACYRCNVLIGFADDDPELLMKIARNFAPVLAATRSRIDQRLREKP